MNKLIIILAGTVLATAAAAQDTQNTQNTPNTHSTQNISEVRVPASAARIEFPAELGNMWYDEFDKVKGTYYLSDGRTMQLSLWGNRIYARIDGIGRLPLVAASPYVFVARNLQVKISIDDPDAGAGALQATVGLAAPLLSSNAPAGQMLTLLARR